MESNSDRSIETAPVQRLFLCSPMRIRWRSGLEMTVSPRMLLSERLTDDRRWTLILFIDMMIITASTAFIWDMHQIFFFFIMDDSNVQSVLSSVFSFERNPVELEIRYSTKSTSIIDRRRRCMLVNTQCILSFFLCFVNLSSHWSVFTNIMCRVRRVANEATRSPTNDRQDDARNSWWFHSRLF